MSEEIKDILNKFDKVLENYELDKKIKQFSVDSICHLFPNEMLTIKSTIDNQRKEIDRLNNIINELEVFLKEGTELATGCGITKEYIYAYENALDKLKELKENK